MKVFRDLFISGDSSKFGPVIEAIEKSLADGWRREKDREERGLYWFACTEKDYRRAVFLVLAEKTPGLLYVPNIVPVKRHQLSHDEYNAVLEEFTDRFARPSAEPAGLKVELTGAEADLEHWLSKAAAEKLRRFSASANKSIAASHPSDLERWMDFLVTANRDGGRLDPTLLRRWLIEVEKWPPEVADQLTGEYEFGRGLLAFADGARRSA